MNRVNLSVAALLVAGFAFAQSPQTVASPGQQTAPVAVLPAASAGGNYSNIDQKAVGSDATVQQQGTSNISFIDQTGSNASKKNNVDVLQWGNVQPGISGYLNYSDIKQTGAGNNFDLMQQGDKNENFGLQNGVDNSVVVQQGANTPQQAEKNLALSDQDGLENYAEIQQRYDNNKATITQRNDVSSGAGNWSYQEQIANPNQSAGHTAVGEQWGDDNTLIQLQEGSASGPNSLGNYAQANQGDALAAPDSATGAFAQQVQLGDGNEAYAGQKLTNDTSFQEQIGDLNLAEVKQNLSGSNAGGDNHAEQYQDGNLNEARIDQNGNNNIALQEQYGDDNYSKIKQRYGQVTGNEAISYQNGTLNNSVINQQANANMALVDQTGDGQMSVINQNNPLNGSPAATSGSNSATVIQRNANVALTPSALKAAQTRADRRR
ncbi:MAG: hypothetical protein VX550_03385 [Bacteroidota bacterium]|nr:hypothetical protein [Bacteroidota bacterium]